MRLELTFAVRHNQQGKDILEGETAKSCDAWVTFYGKHLSNEEVHRILQPAEEHVARVKAFLKSFQVTFESINSDLIVCDVSVRQAEALLGAEYYELRQIDGGREHGSIHRI